MKLMLVLLGSLLLLLSFLTQQFLFEWWNARSAQIQEGDARFLTYQSNNHLFNAIIELVPEERITRVRQLQLMNYQTALEQLWSEVTPHTRALLAERGVRRIGSSTILNARTPDQIQEIGGRVQAQIDSLVREFRNEQASIKQNRWTAHLVFAALYVIGSLLLVFGNFVPSQSDGDAHRSEIG